jgi:uncharacterized repeat protein (TIGR03803 family)
MLRPFLALCFVLMLASGCAQRVPASTSLIPSAQSVSPSSARSASSGYSILYSFMGGSDGAFPQSALISSNGLLYGTTAGNDVATDHGTVFSITTSGQERVLHRFRGTDGAQPIAALTSINGTLYGSTLQGGAGYGTLFKIKQGGSGYQTLHRFAGTAKGDGAEPASAMIHVGRALYGTTQRGGSAGYGSFYKINPDGSGYTVLHSFAGPGARDAADPEGNLVLVSGSLYGTSYDGGTGCDNYPSVGCGTVFAVTTSGSERVVYRFGSKGANDGANPVAVGLLWYGGLLYGTTSQNAHSVCFQATGCGTIFSVTTSGVEKVLHRFGPDGTANGATPEAGLIAMDGTIYGSTWGGGSGGPGGGNGTVFRSSTAGLESVIYNFGGPSVSDGAEPNGLVGLGGALYGTAQIGGSAACANANHCGIVFKVAP